MEAPDAVITSDHGTALAVAHGRASLAEAESDRRRSRSAATATRPCASSGFSPYRSLQRRRLR